MSSDGAHLGIDAKSALGVILGGKEEPEGKEPIEFEKMVRFAPLGPVKELDYGGGANATARLVLEAYENYPQLTELSDSWVYLRGLDGKIDWDKPIVLNVTLYEVVKKLNPEHQELFSSLTGFMWGWAVNAARSILDLGPLPNPAIVEAGSSDVGGGVSTDELFSEEE